MLFGLGLVVVPVEAASVEAAAETFVVEIGALLARIPPYLILSSSHYLFKKFLIYPLIPMLG
jgi:hypothetical protein